MNNLLSLLLLGALPIYLHSAEAKPAWATSGGTSAAGGLPTATVTADGVSWTFVRIPAGSYVSGREAKDPGHRANEYAAKRSMKSLWVGETEVTAAFYARVVGRDPNPDYWKEPNLPVAYVSLYDAEALAAAVNKRFPGAKLRVPSEWEWEYACRAGGTAQIAGSGAIGDVAVTDETSGLEQRPLAVRSRKPNQWGLFDMHGNLAEWTCSLMKERTDNDDAASNTLGWISRKVEEKEETGPAKDGEKYAVRGGSWTTPPAYAEAAVRDELYSDRTNDHTGIRLVMDAE